MPAMSSDQLYKMYREECALNGDLAEFDALIKRGCTPQMAVSLVTRTPCGSSQTERALFEGHSLNHGFTNEPVWLQEAIITQAHRAGIRTHGKVYKQQLADGRGPATPEAWVAGIDDIADVYKKRKHQSCEGGFRFKGQEAPPTPDVPLAEDSIREYAQHYTAEDPKWKKKPQELREMIIETHGAPARGRGPKVKNPKLRKGRDKPSLAVEIEGL